MKKIYKATGKLALTALAIGLLFAPLATSARADDFALVTGDDYPPFTGTNLINQGLATAIVRTAFKRMGHEVTVAFKPWKRGYADVQAGKFLGTFPYGKNADREALFHYSEPLYTFGQYFFAKSDSPHKFEEDEDLAGLRICLPIGYNPVRVKKLVEAGTVTMVRPPDIESCFKMVDRGRADLVRVNDIVGWSIVESLYGNRDGFRMIATPVRESIEHFIVPRSNPKGGAMISAFNEALMQMQRSGEIFRLIERHVR
ncbi:MAG: transporter substrate-binding domain-containing protein [Pseudomonadota bacterium]